MQAFRLPGFPLFVAWLSEVASGFLLSVHCGLGFLCGFRLSTFRGNVGLGFLKRLPAFCLPPRKPAAGIHDSWYDDGEDGEDAEYDAWFESHYDQSEWDDSEA